MHTLSNSSNMQITMTKLFNGSGEEVSTPKLLSTRFNRGLQSIYWAIKSKKLRADEHGLVIVSEFQEYLASIKLGRPRQ